MTAIERFWSALIGLVVGALIFSGAFLVFKHEVEINEIQGNRFTSQDFMQWITNAPELGDSLREAIGIPPPVVTNALDSLRTSRDSLRAVTDSLSGRLSELEDLVRR